MTTKTTKTSELSAAHKAWVTRRASGNTSAAALKAWATRRAKKTASQIADEATNAVEPTTYLLRDIDSNVWEQFKQRADASGIPMRTVLLELVGAFASGAIDVKQQLVVSSRKATQ